MASYDPDRLAALAAGQIPPDEAAALEQEISADPRAAAELAAQRVAFQALRQAPIPILTAEERSELRRSVAAALNLEEAPAMAVAASGRRRVPWVPIAVAAAAVAVIAAVVPLTGLLSIGGERAAQVTTLEDSFAARTEATVPAVSGPADENQTDAGAGLLGTEADEDAEKAVQELLSEPGPVIASADPALSTCEAAAQSLLGGADSLTAVTLNREGRELVAWFVAGEGPTLRRLALFDPIDCRLLAAHL